MSFSRDTIVKSFIWKLLERSGAQLVSFAVSIILARLLTPKEYGLVAIITMFLNLASVIIDGGLNTALIQKKNADDVDFSTIFHVSMIMSLLLYLVLFFSAPAIASFYKQPDLTLVLRVLSVTLFLNAFNSIQRAYVSKHMLFRKLMICSIIAGVSSGIVGIIMAYRGYGVWSLVAQSITSQLFTTLLMLFTIKWYPQRVFSFERFKSLFNYGWKILSTNFIIALYLDVRGIIIGKLYMPQTLALFDRGKQFPALLMGNINASLQTILFPVFSEEQDNRTRVKEMMRRSMKTSCLFIFPILVGLFVVSRPLILFLLTDKWEGVIPFLRIFCLAYIMMPLQIANMEAIKSLGYSNITLKLEIIKKIIETVILVLSFLIGIYAVAWGVVLYNAICLFINLYPNIKLLNYTLSEQIKDVLPSLVVSLLMGASVFWIQFLPLTNFIVLSLQVILGVIVYVCLCKLFRIESFDYVWSFIIRGTSK